MKKKIFTLVEDGEEKKEDDDEEEEVEGKRRDEEDIQDSPVLQEGMILKFPLGPSCHFCSSCFKDFFLQQEEVKKQHGKDTQRPNIMNYILTPEAPDHLPLATQCCLLEQCNHLTRTF